MYVVLRICRVVNPKRYIRIQLVKLHSALKGPRHINVSRDPAYVDLHQRIGDDIDELNEWQQSIEDSELQARARKIGVYIDEIEFDKTAEYLSCRPYLEYGAFGYDLLHEEVRRSLRKMVREREPSYRKERRERIELFTKAGTVITGLLGVAVAMIALLKK